MYSESSHRLSTVYDYSSLRIHPDGSRVNQSSHNHRPRKSRKSVQDSRGNWFARDAGGSATVGKYRKVRDETSEGEDFDFGDVRSQDSGNGNRETSEGKGKEKDTAVDVDRRQRSGRSAAKRQTFYHDFEFLATQPPVGGTPLPSSVSSFLFVGFRFSVLVLRIVRICSSVYTILQARIIMNEANYSMDRGSFAGREGRGYKKRRFIQRPLLYVELQMMILIN